MALVLPPVPIGEPAGSFAWDQWYLSLQQLFAGTGTVPWALVDTSGSNITDIASRAHNNLQTIQGGTSGEFYHLTSAQHTDLTDAGDTTLHIHNADRARANHTGTQTLATISDAGTIASQAANNVAITGGSVTDVTLTLLSFAKASLPVATTAGRLIYVTDETGGAVPAFSDGTNWRRVTDRAVVA